MQHIEVHLVVLCCMKCLVFMCSMLELKSHVKSPETIWQNNDKIENQELLKHLPGLCMELELELWRSCGRVTAAGCVPAVPGMDLGGEGEERGGGEGRTGRRRGSRQLTSDTCNLVSDLPCVRYTVGGRL